MQTKPSLNLRVETAAISTQLNIPGAVYNYVDGSQSSIGNFLCHLLNTALPKPTLYAALVAKHRGAHAVWLSFLFVTQSALLIFSFLLFLYYIASVEYFYRMKKLLFFISAVVLLSSCEKTPVCKCETGGAKYEISGITEAECTAHQAKYPGRTCTYDD
jgi:hypothetical protein